MLNISRFTPTQWLVAFILMHVVVWTLMPTLVRIQLPMDALEGASWGKHLMLGYDKNPFVNAWLTALALYLGNYADWIIYLFSQLSVGICFWVVWQIGKKMVPPIHALIAVLLLEGMQYYNLHAIDFSDNTLELSTWSLTIYFFYLALTENKFYQWIGVGIFAGLALMTKYFSVMLILSCLLFMIFNKTARIHFTNTAFYIGLIICLLIILPHVIWLFHHELITIKYALNRVKSSSAPFNHLFFPAQFAWQQFEVLIPTLLLFLILTLKNKRVFHQPAITSSFNLQFINWIAWAPFCLTLILSLISGIRLRAAWGMPLFSWYGLLLIIYFKPVLSLKRYYLFLAMVLFFMLCNLTGYTFALLHAKETSSAIFPGKRIAAYLTREWHERFHTPLKIVAGNRFIAGSIAHYSKDHPDILIDFNPKISSVITEKNILRTGAIFIWDLDGKNQINFNEIKARYPINTIEIQTYFWERNALLPPIRLQIAWLNPLTST